MKILVLTNLYPPQVLGGYERAIADFARLLQSRGHSVLVLTSNSGNFHGGHTSLDSDPPVERTLLLCGQWHEHERSGWFPRDQVAVNNSHNLAVLEHQLQTFQPDLCLAGNFTFLLIDLVERLLAAGIPVVHYIMNEQADYPPERTPATPLYRFVTCSDWVTQQLQAANYPTPKAVTIYPGAAVDAFYQPQLPEQDILRIAYASLVMHYKGADVLLEALCLLHAAGIKFTATIAGSTLTPHFVECLKNLVKEEGIENQVKFTGVLSRQELIQVYKTHNVLAFPSRFEEPFGISQVEAMAAGLTLVTSGTGGAREIVEQGQDGFLFESENPLDLANVLSYLPAHPGEWEEIARRGQQKALTEFSQEKAVEQLEAVFQEMLDLKASSKTPLPDKQYAIGRFQLQLPGNHALDQYQATWHRYDQALGYIARTVVQKYPQCCAIDIGANVGDTAALLRNYVDVPILCVEGNPEFLLHLERNAAIIGNLEIERCFVGRDGEKVEVNRILNYGGTATVLAAMGATTEQSVAMQSLDTLLQNHPPFQQTKLLKIDTDGYDFSILKQSAVLLQTLRPILYFEYDTSVQAEAPGEALEAINVLFLAGYCHFMVYDNFGNYVISLSGQERDRFVDLNTCLASNRKKSGTPVIYYFDICCFTAQDGDLFEQLRQIECDLVQG